MAKPEIGISIYLHKGSLGYKMVIIMFIRLPHNDIVNKNIILLHTQKHRYKHFYDGIIATKDKDNNSSKLQK